MLNSGDNERKKALNRRLGQVFPKITKPVPQAQRTKEFNRLLNSKAVRSMNLPKSRPANKPFFNPKAKIDKSQVFDRTKLGQEQDLEHLRSLMRSRQRRTS